MSKVIKIEQGNIKKGCFWLRALSFRLSPRRLLEIPGRFQTCWCTVGSLGVQLVAKDAIATPSALGLLYGQNPCQ